MTTKKTARTKAQFSKLRAYAEARVFLDSLKDDETIALVTAEKRRRARLEAAQKKREEYCPKMEDGTHCEHWWEDPNAACCACGRK